MAIITITITIIKLEWNTQNSETKSRRASLSWNGKMNLLWF